MYSRPRPRRGWRGWRSRRNRGKLARMLALVPLRICCWSVWIRGRLGGPAGGGAGVWPLPPLQEGLLFHALYDADAPDVYTVQHFFDLEGPVDPARLRAAGQGLLERHVNLRAGVRRV